MTARSGPTGSHGVRPSSRTDAFSAGWDEGGNVRSGSAARPGSWWLRLRNERISPKWDRFSWLTVRALFESVNDRLAKQQREIVNSRRLRWVARQRAAGVNDFPPERGGRLRPGFLVDHTEHGETLAFFLIGDTGEQDASQYCVTPLLTGEPESKGPREEPRHTEFMIIVSDVIYPAGDVNEYINGFYIPYRHYQRPIYAIPGNHDWYDGLNGFMYHFCGAEPLPTEAFRLTNVKPATRLASWLWRGAEPPDRPLLSRWRDSRRADGQDGAPLQPTPYFAVETRDLLIVAIDTGITGEIDDEQGRWLIEVSQLQKQKILLTGKPIYVDGAYHPGEIAWRSGPPKADDRPGSPRIKTVDDVVRYGPFGYVAAVGGDVHNYQRYPIWHKQQQRLIHYLVSGGGGAYLSPTYRIPAIGGAPQESAERPWPAREVSMPTENGPDDDCRAFRCYPQRGDSLAYGARRAGPRLFTLLVVAAAAFCASVWLFSHGLPRPEGLPAAAQVRESARLGPLAVYGVIGAVAFLLLWFMSSWRPIEARYRSLRIKAETQEAEVPTTTVSVTSDTPGKRQVRWLALLRRLIFFAPLLAIVGSTYAIDRLVDQELITDGQFWIAVGLSLAVPILVIAVILLGHDLRGSIGTTIPDLMTVGALIAAAFILFDPPSVPEAPSWFVGVASALILGALGLLLIGLLRNAAALPDSPPDPSTPEEPPPAAGGPKVAEEPTMSNPRKAAFVTLNLLAVLAPAVLGVVLALKFDSTWAKWLSIAVAAPVIIGACAAFGQGAPPGASERLTPGLRRLKSAANLVATLTWVLVSLLLLSEIGDGWVTTGVVAASTFLLIAVVLLILRAMATLTNLWRTQFVLYAAMAVIFLAFLLSTGVLLFAFAAFLGLMIWAVVPLRRGRLNANRAGAFMADRLDLKPSARDGVDLPTGREAGLADLLYPFDASDDQKRGTGRFIGEAAKWFSELSDADEPPFFKHFLRVDLEPTNSAKGFDRSLTIRCFGVTGFATEEEDVPLEDELVIPFYSAEKWASRA